jgi:hypothetical protein
MKTQKRTTKKHNAFLISLTALFIASLACSLGSGASTVPPASSPEPSLQATTNSTTDNPNENPQGPEDLGAITYTLDTARQESVIFDPSAGLSANLAVKDANGYIWMLIIPADALPMTETITMTPFATMDVSQSGAKIISGVQLEPDGLHFVDAVLLTVNPPMDNPGVGLIFSMQQDGSSVDFAPTTNTTGGKTAIATIWHFSAAGYTNLTKDEYEEYLRELAEARFFRATEAARVFLNNPPKPPAPPMISQFCRGTEVNPEETIQADLYEFRRTFYDPYEDVVVDLLSSAKAVALLDPGFDIGIGGAWAEDVVLKAEENLKIWGRQATKDKPPDRLVALIDTGMYVLKQHQLLSSSEKSGEFMFWITGWQETLRDYYLDELKTKHDFRAFPILVTMEKRTALLGGIPRLEDILSAMTFEVILDTSFDGNWKSSGKTIATGNVIQNADVKDLKMVLTSEGLWGDLNNLQLKAKSGTYTDANETTSLAGMTDTGQLWLKNWDPCVTKTFDVLISGLYGEADSKPGTVAGPAAAASFKQYYWEGAAAFMFTIPIKNLDANMGEQTFTGSGSAADGGYSGSGKLHIVLKHTP